MPKMGFRAEAWQAIYPADNFWQFRAVNAL